MFFGLLRNSKILGSVGGGLAAGGLQEPGICRNLRCCLEGRMVCGVDVFGCSLLVGLSMRCLGLLGLLVGCRLSSLLLLFLLIWFRLDFTI